MYCIYILKVKKNMEEMKSFSELLGAIENENNCSYYDKIGSDYNYYSNINEYDY